MSIVESGARAVADVLEVDVEERYNEVRDWLQIPGDSLHDREVMIERLNEAASVALLAHGLYLKVRRACMAKRLKLLGGVRELKRKATLRIKDWQDMNGGGKALSDKMIEEEILGSPTLSEPYATIQDEVEQLTGVEEAFHELWQRARGRETLLQTQKSAAFPDKMVTIEAK